MEILFIFFWFFDFCFAVCISFGKLTLSVCPSPLGASRGLSKFDLIKRFDIAIEESRFVVEIVRNVFPLLTSFRAFYLFFHLRAISWQFFDVRAANAYVAKVTRKKPIFSVIFSDEWISRGQKKNNPEIEFQSRNQSLGNNRAYYFYFSHIPGQIFKSPFVNNFWISKI